MTISISKILKFSISFFLFVVAYNLSNAQSIVATGKFCTSNDIEFKLVPPAVGADSIVWSFNDPASGKDSISRASRPVHRFNSAGNYTVSAKIYQGGVLTSTKTLPVLINQGPKYFDLGPDTIICKKGDIIKVGPYYNNSYSPEPAGLKYLWSTGDSTSTINIDSAGCYSVTVTDPVGGCSITDKLIVKEYRKPRKEGVKWYFGTTAGIDFSLGSAVPLTNGQLSTTEGSSVISDKYGKLLFYTNGVTVYDQTGAIMTDTSGVPVTNLNGSDISTQSALIVPQPDDEGCGNIYYIFTTGDIATGTGLQYSVVDMRKNAGKGQIIEKNVPLVPGPTAPALSSTEKLTAYTSTDGNTNWVIAHDFKTNVFRVIPVTKNGLDFSAAKTFSSGSIAGPNNAQGQGYMKLSADGTKLAVTIPGDPGNPNIVEIYQFIDSTGTISPIPIKLSVGKSPSPVYGVDFSSDGTVMYVTRSKQGATDSSYLYQYDLIQFDSTSVAQSKTTLDSSATLSYGAVQIAPDQQVYMAIKNSPKLSVVTNPSGLGANAGYQSSSFDLGGKISQLGLPNFVQSFFEPATGQGFTYRDTCSGGPTFFYAFPDLPDPGGQNKYSWDFGDGNQLSGTGIANQNPTHTYSINGDITVKLTIQNRCTTEVFTQTITILRAPDTFVNWNKTISICQGQPATLDPYPGQSGPLGATYTWSTPSGIIVAKAISASVAGLYSVVVNVAGCTKSDAVQVNINTIPVNLGIDQSFCEGVSATLDAGNPGSTYQWLKDRLPISGAVQRFLTVTATGEYIAIVTNTLSGCSGSDTVQINVTQKARAIVTKTDPTTICGNNDGTITVAIASGGSFDLPTGQKTSAPTGAIVFVNNGAGGFTASNLTAGSYSITIRATSTTCDTTYLVSLSDPIAFTADSTITNVTKCNGNDGSITINPNPAVGAYTYTWRNETTGTNIVANPLSPVLTGLSPGRYSVQVQSGTCSKFFTDLIINDFPKPVIQIAGDSIQQFCSSGNTYGLSIVDDPLLTGNYNWSGDDGSSYSGKSVVVSLVQAQTIYTVTYTDGNNCSVTDNVVVQFRGLPYINLNNNTPSVCEGNTFTLDAAFNPPFGFDPTTVFYKWMDQNGATLVQGLGLSTYTTGTAGTYSVVAQNNTGCPPTAPLQAILTVTPKPIFNPIASKNAICNGEVISIASNISNAGSFIFQLLDQNRGLLSQNTTGNFTGLQPAASTFYIISVANSIGNCPAEEKQVAITVSPQPLSTLPDNISYCASNLQVIDPDPNNVNPAGTTYLWSTDQTTKTIKPPVSGRYSVIITSGQCVISDTIVVTVTPALKVSIPLKEVSLCLKNGGSPQATLDAGSGDNVSYFWFHSGETTRTVVVTQPGKYVVRISKTDDNSCSAQDTIQVLDKCEAFLLVPKAFTPNGEGPQENEQLKYYGNLSLISDFEITIFNRWGEAIFQTTNINTYWDGKYKGVAVPPGTYAYKVSYRSVDYPEQPLTTFKGGVMVLR